MRMVFVTSCLEPGKDGVGDYTRELAFACEALGHSCWLLALSDRHIERPLHEQQTATGAMLQTLRLPAADSWSRRIRYAQSWLERSAVDWISLQFVPYGYHPKGLVRGLHRRLAPLFAGRSLHVMLHELWIGAERGAPLRRRVIGHLQQRAVLALVRRLDPAVIHTSNDAYLALLRAHDICAKTLFLCGSIPVSANPNMRWFSRELTALGVPAHQATSRDACW